MQRLAFSTLPCKGWPLEQMVALAKSCGVAAMELREGADWSVSAEMNREERREARLKLEKAGIRITNIGSSVCYTGRDSDERQHEAFGRSAALAQDLGASGVRIFLGYFRSRRSEPIADIPYESLVSRIRAACEEAAARDVQVWIETHNEFSTGQTLRKLLDDVDRANCAVIYDVIHPLEEGEPPEETIRLLGSRCAHVHMKDGLPWDDPDLSNWKYTRIGEGRIPLASIVTLLEEANYSGYYSLEWETPWKRELQQPGMEPETVMPAYVSCMADLFD